MAKKIADLLVVISGDSENLRKELNAIKRQINSAFGGKAMDLSEKVAGSFKYLAAGAVALGVAAVKMNADMAMTARAFEVLTGDADKAREHLGQLESFAASTPFEFPGLVEASKKLQAYGFETEAVIPIMKAVGDAAMAVGLGQEGIDRITLALGQMNAKGKLSAEEMRQLAETGLPAWEMLAQGIGVSVPQAMEMAKKGAIDATAGIGALLTGLDSKFNGMMDKMAGEIPQSFSNMQDSVKSIMRTLGADITETFDLKTKMKGAADWLSEFASLAKNSGIREALDQMIPESVRTAIVGISGAIVGIAVPAFALLAVNVIAATWPILAIGAACAAAAVLIYKNWSILGPFFSVLWQGIVSIARWAWDALSYIFNLIASLVSGVTDKISSFVALVRRVKSFALTGVMPESEVKVDTKEVDTAKKKVWSLKDAIDSLKPVGMPVGIAGGVPRVGGSGGVKIGASKAISSETDELKKQQQEYERLAEKAKSVSDHIEDEWLQQTNAQMAMLDKWYQKELKTLNESKAVNENYERDKERLRQSYDIKKKKLLDEEVRETEKVCKKIKDIYDNLYSKLQITSLRGSEKGLFNITEKADQDVEKIKTVFNEIVDDYANATTEQQKTIIEALRKAGITRYEINKGQLNLDGELQKYELERYKLLQDEKVSYFRQCQDIKADTEEAYNDSSLARLQQVLNKENLMRLENFNAQKRIMDLYQNVTIAAHMTTAEQVASLLDNSRGLFKAFFSSILTGTKDFGDALKDLLSDIWGNIAEQISEKLSNQIVEGLFGMLSGGNEGGGIFGSLFGGLFGGGKGAGVAEENPVAAVTDSFAMLTETSTSLGEGMSSFSGIVGAGSALMKAYNSLQTVLNAATKPAETTTTVAATTALGAFTVAVGAATEALAAMAIKSFIPIPGLASGGAVVGPGSGTSDSIPAMLSNGEYVISAAAVRKLGLPLLDRLNSGRTRGYASGGLVSDAAFDRLLARGFSAPKGGNVTTTTVNIYGDINSASEEESIFNKLYQDTRFALMGA